MADVITQVIVSDTREIRANLPFEPGGETLEHRFRINFAPNRQIALGSRKVSVFVQFEGTGSGRFPVLVTLHRPDGTIAAGPMEMDNRPLVGQPIPASGGGGTSGGTSTFGTNTPSRSVSDVGIGTSPGVVFAVNTGAGPGGIGTGGLGDGPDQPPPPPDIDRLTYTIANPDPNGEWSVTITNTGTQDGIFSILIVHPGAQKTLKTSTIPISLVERMLQTARRLVDPRLRIGAQAIMTFSPEFEHLTGIGSQQFADGLDTRDINMNRFEVGISGTGGVVALHAGVGFETGGKDEIEVDIFDDVDFSKLEFDLELALGSRFSTAGSHDVLISNPRPVLVQQRNLAGQLDHELSGRVSLQFDLNVVAEASVNIPTHVLNELFGDVDVDNIDDFIRHKFNAAVLGESGRKKIGALAEHFTDALVFLATGSRSQLFFDVTSDGDNIVVSHYSKPTVLDLVRPHAPSDAEVSGASGGGTTGVGPGGQGISDAVINAVLAATPGLTFSRGGAASASDPARGTVSASSMVNVLANRTAGRSSTRSSTTFNLAALSDLVAAPPADTVLDPTLGGGSGAGRQIEHIVVLMLENRSFDHMLGYLSLEGGRGDVDGLRGPSDNTNPVPGSQTPQGVHRLDVGNILVDPNHSHEGTLEQIADGAMSGFMASYLRRDPAPDAANQVMGYYNAGFVNVYNWLAQEYKICDRWFCAHPGPTYPNRFISLTGSTPSLNNIELGGELAGAMKTDTIFDILTLNGVSWKYVEGNLAFLRMFDRYRVDEKNIIQRSEFARLAVAGRLPAVTWIDPNFGELEVDNEANDDHPPADVRNGQKLVCDIYRLLTKNRAQWNKTLFIIDYDEHGGFYDHVPPHGLQDGASPHVPKIHPDGKTFYGPRVPAMLISPWVARGGVTSKIYDHTSVLKTILVNFIGPEAATQELLGKRVDAANDLLDELEPKARTQVPGCPDAVPVGSELPANALAGRPIESDSFHLSMRLFPFGPKLKDLVSAR